MLVTKGLFKTVIGLLAFFSTNAIAAETDAINSAVLLPWVLFILTILGSLFMFKKAGAKCKYNSNQLSHVKETLTKISEGDYEAKTEVPEGNQQWKDVCTLLNTAGENMGALFTQQNEMSSTMNGRFEEMNATL